jgi:hypothetical protein
MTDSPVVLDYAPPPPSLSSRAAVRLLKCLRVVSRVVLKLALRFLQFAFLHPLQPLHVAIAGAWSAMALYAYIAVHDAWFYADYHASCSLFVATTIVTLAIVVKLIVMKRRWRQLVAWLAVSLPTIPLAGAYQFDECQHAKYVQLFGISFAYSGRACHNARNTVPWWARR